MADTLYRRTVRDNTLQGASPASMQAQVPRLRAHQRYLVASDGLARTARARNIANLVGTGIKVRWESQELQEIWDSWCKDCNLNGYGTFATMQYLTALAGFDGDAFVRLCIVDQAGIPLRLQALESDFCDHADTNSVDIFAGIRFDLSGKPVSYRFWQRHPYYNLPGKVANRVEIPAVEVCHYLLKDSANQIRGTPALAAVLDLFYEASDFTDATVSRQIAAQGLAYVVKKATSGALPALGTPELITTVNSAGAKTFKPVQRIDPQTVTYLNPDESIEALTVPDVGDTFSRLLMNQYRVIAGACDLTYEQLTGDLTGVNYSSARVGEITIRRVTEQRQQLQLIPSLVHPIAMRFREFAGLLKARYGKEVPRYEIPAVAEIDPLKAANAQIARIRAGLTTLEAELARENLDFSTVVEQIALEQGLNITLSSNPAKDKTAP